MTSAVSWWHELQGTLGKATVSSERRYREICGLLLIALRDIRGELLSCGLMLFGLEVDGNHGMLRVRWVERIF